MTKRINQLSFIIGAFFLCLAIILLGGYAFSELLRAKINLYSGITFLLFGGLMVFIKSEEAEGTEGK